jgi:predicted HicB family RNase H-like nuclease
MIDPTNYTISVRKGWFDGELCFEARVFELPDIAEYADSYEEAYQLTLDTLVTTAEIFVEQGRTMPEPMISNNESSDYIMLNLAKNLYRTLTLAAKNEGVNLNQHLVNVLNQYADCVH